MALLFLFVLAGGVGVSSVLQKFVAGSTNSVGWFRATGIAVVSVTLVICLFGLFGMILSILVPFMVLKLRVSGVGVRDVLGQLVLASDEEGKFLNREVPSAQDREDLPQDPFLLMQAEMVEKNRREKHRHRSDTVRDTA